MCSFLNECIRRSSGPENLCCKKKRANVSQVEKRSQKHIKVGL